MIQQLSIFDLPVQDTPTKLRYPNPKKAKKFRDLAERMQSQIDNKLNPEIIGKISAIGKNFIIVPTNPGITADDFIMFSKNKAVNNSSLLGYYAEVKLSNDSTDKVELFSIGSEVTQSSK